MKRYEKIKNNELKLIWGYIFGCILGIIFSFDFSGGEVKCTPSQEHQEVMDYLSGIDNKIEFLFQLSEVSK